MFWFKHANTRKHISEKSWLSGWIILNTLAHLAHLAQFYFSLIFSAINTYNCFWFDLTEKKEKILVTEVKSMVKSDQCLRLFSSRRQPLLLVNIVTSTNEISMFFFRSTCLLFCRHAVHQFVFWHQAEISLLLWRRRIQRQGYDSLISRDW